MEEIRVKKRKRPDKCIIALMSQGMLGLRSTTDGLGPPAEKGSGTGTATSTDQGTLSRNIEARLYRTRFLVFGISF